MNNGGGKMKQQEFLWGASTSAYQIEGAWNEDGRGESIWDRFCHEPGHIHYGDTGDVACDHYHRLEQDVDLMREIGLKAYRFSISWPRIFPQGYGAVNPAGVAFYHELVDLLRENGITPFATLYHWDLPQALQDEGGWTRRETALHFAEYARFMFREFGDSVRHWITINEPQVFATMGYMDGLHAPGIRDTALTPVVIHHALLGHALAVQAFRESGMAGEIGIALNLTQYYPFTDSSQDVATVELADAIGNRWFLDPLLKGSYPQEGYHAWRLLGTNPEFDPVDMDILCEPIDFLGINHYHASFLAHDPEKVAVNRNAQKGLPVTHYNDWPLYSRSIYDVLMTIRDRYGNLPTYITENGASYHDHMDEDGEVRDDLRASYIEQYTGMVKQAAAHGADVRGYFVWSLMDNFEWNDGYEPRFGIVHVDFKTQRRTWKSSAYAYRRIIQGG